MDGRDRRCTKGWENRGLESRDPYARMRVLIQSSNRHKNQTSSVLLRSDEVRPPLKSESTPCANSAVPTHSVVLLRSGPHASRIAVIAEIIDHNRVSTQWIL